ncbi:pseudouridine synthase, partial [Mrakia frigida]|uniref:pseudouridine synthase DEG1 n=1 Tax=Mrakia frigida TaxID=29902 RepID=UPI003FCC00FF
FDDYPRRKIALKLSYLGSPYCGLTSQGTAITPLPTVEGVLKDVLEKASLIEPGKGWDGCGFARCGRTDRGVSAAGQVVSFWIKTKEFNGSLKVEYPYLNIINKLLPDTIRILAWSPLHPASEFDARYSCSYRHYKYFFSLNAIPSGADADGRVLDVEKMQEAASYLVGEHDFRNFCKIDGSKQITNYTRRIHSATISPDLLASQPPSETAPGQFFVLDLLGRAFLYHQVRHIMAILFLVGAGLEKPTVVKDLLSWEFKPTYEMADGEPLLLWDCGFPEGLLNWQ